MTLGPLELTLILVIVILLFGVGRIGKIAGEIGSGIKEFRKGLQDEDTSSETASSEENNSTDIDAS
jgi:sec-independent protein translocase protein TatA